MLPCTCSRHPRTKRRSRCVSAWEQGQQRHHIGWPAARSGWVGDQVQCGSCWRQWGGSSVCLCMEYSAGRIGNPACCPGMLIARGHTLSHSLILFFFLSMCLAL